MEGNRRFDPARSFESSGRSRGRKAASCSPLPCNRNVLAKGFMSDASWHRRYNKAGDRRLVSSHLRSHSAQPKAGVYDGMTIGSSICQHSKLGSRNPSSWPSTANSINWLSAGGPDNYAECEYCERRWNTPANYNRFASGGSNRPWLQNPLHPDATFGGAAKHDVNLSLNSLNTSISDNSQWPHVNSSDLSPFPRGTRSLMDVAPTTNTIASSDLVKSNSSFGAVQSPLFFSSPIADLDPSKSLAASTSARLDFDSSIDTPHFNQHTQQHIQMHTRFSKESFIVSGCTRQQRRVYDENTSLSRANRVDNEVRELEHCKVEGLNGAASHRFTTHQNSPFFTPCNESSKQKTMQTLGINLPASKVAAAASERNSVRKSPSAAEAKHHEATASLSSRQHNYDKTVISATCQSRASSPIVTSIFNNATVPLKAPHAAGAVNIPQKSSLHCMGQFSQAQSKQAAAENAADGMQQSEISPSISVSSVSPRKLYSTPISNLPLFKCKPKTTKVNVAPTPPTANDRSARPSPPYQSSPRTPAKLVTATSENKKYVARKPNYERKPEKRYLRASPLYIRARVETCSTTSSVFSSTEVATEAVGTKASSVKKTELKAEKCGVPGRHLGLTTTDTTRDSSKSEGKDDWNQRKREKTQKSQKSNSLHLQTEVDIHNSLGHPQRKKSDNRRSTHWKERFPSLGTPGEGKARDLVSGSTYLFTHMVHLIEKQAGDQ